MSTMTKSIAGTATGLFVAVAMFVLIAGGAPRPSVAETPSTRPVGDMPRVSLDGFPYGQCTDYVAWRLDRAGVQVDYGRFPGGWDAKNWPAHAAALGYRVDSTPAPGAAAVSYAGTHGHIAVVVSVNADRTLTVEDYNWLYSRHYMLHTVGPGFFTRFVHFDDARVAGTTSGPPPVAPGPSGTHVTAAPSVHLRSGPGKSFGIVGELAQGVPVNIRCQAWSSSTEDGSHIWDNLGNTWVSDYWVSTPVFNGFSPGIPKCPTSTERGPNHV